MQSSLTATLRSSELRQDRNASAAKSGSYFGAVPKAIGALRATDTFNLITFAGSTHILWDKPRPATPKNVAEAQGFLASQQGRGGTEMMKAIDAALVQTKPDVDDGVRPIRIVCFMTDGYVGNDMAIIAAVKKNADTTRVFSFGIGNSVNRFLLDGMARAGRGEVEYVLLQDESDAAVARFSQRIQTPVLTDIELAFEGVKVTDVVPRQIPDLFDIKPLILHGRYATPGKGTLVIRGKTGAGPYERKVAIDLPEREPGHDTTATLWARATVEELMNQDLAAVQKGNYPKELRDEVIRLGETHGIMTQFTSFVAVEKARVTIGGEPRLVAVPVEMPDGVSYEGIFGNILAPDADADAVVKFPNIDIDGDGAAEMVFGLPLALGRPASGETTITVDRTIAFETKSLDAWGAPAQEGKTTLSSRGVTLLGRWSSGTRFGGAPAGIAAGGGMGGGMGGGIGGGMGGGMGRRSYGWASVPPGQQRGLQRGHAKRSLRNTTSFERRPLLSTVGGSPGTVMGATWVGFSPDGKRIVTGSADSPVRLWDASTGKPIVAGGRPVQWGAGVSTTTQGEFAAGQIASMRFDLSLDALEELSAATPAEQDASIAAGTDGEKASPAAAEVNIVETLVQLLGQLKTANGIAYANAVLLRERVALKVEALATEKKPDDARKLVDALVTFDEKFAIGVGMRDALADATLTPADRAKRIAELAEQAKARLREVVRQATLRRVLDERLYGLVSAKPGDAVPAGLTVQDGTIRVSVLTRAIDQATTDALARAGLAIEARAASVNVVVGVAPRDKLAAIALLDGVRRIDPTDAR